MPHGAESDPTAPIALSIGRPSNIADAIVELLMLEGIDTVFGVPGGPIMGLFDALARNGGLRTVLCKHEQGAVFAAYGHAMVTGRIGIAVVTSGPGVTNTLTALATAYQDRLPLMLICGQVGGANLGRGSAQDSSAFAVDVVTMTRPVTAMSFCAYSGEQALSVMPHLLRLAHCRKQPVMLQIPCDVLFEHRLPGTRLVSGRGNEVNSVVDVTAAHAVLESLRRARRVAILVGAGARNASTQLLVALAEALGAAVTTTPKGKGTFPEDHPLALGVFGFAGSRWAECALLDNDLDVLVVLGSSLGELSSHGFHTGLHAPTLVHVDTDPAAIGITYPARAVVGDVTTVVALWLRQLSRRARPREVPDWVTTIKANVPRVLNAAASASLAIPLRPERVFVELQHCLPADALLICDIGNSMAFAIHYLTLGAMQGFMINLGFACMGHAPAAALGAFLANPLRPVVAVVGDAAFAMGGFEVHTAVEYRSSQAACGGPVYLVLNNGGNGMVDVGVNAQFGQDSPIDRGLYRHPLNICQLAVGMGAAAERVTEPDMLASAMKRALTAGQGPTVIEVSIASDAIPPMGARLTTLMQFGAETEKVT